MHGSKHEDGGRMNENAIYGVQKKIENGELH